MLSPDIVRWQMVARSPTGSKIVVSADERPAKFSSDGCKAYQLSFGRFANVTVDDLEVTSIKFDGLIEIFIPFDYVLYFIEEKNFIKSINNV